MDTAIKRINRRWFLRGVGGTALAIPALPSLLSAKDAIAAESGRKPIFVAFANRPSNVYNNNLCPSVIQYDEVKTYAGFKIQRSLLRPTVSGGTARLSEVLQAPSDLLTSKLVSKMNVLRGLDYTKAIGHNNAHLGNLAGVGVAGEDDPPNFRVSIDQIMGQSSSFYGNFNGVRRVLLVGNDGGQSLGSWTRTTAEGPIVKTPGAIRNPADVFKTMFGNFKPQATNPRTPMVDLVKESFSREARLNSRLSRQDRVRLEDHVALIADIERRSNLNPPDCISPQSPAAFNPGPNATDQLRYYKELSDVVLAAIGCELTRVVVFGLDWLQVVAGADMHQYAEHNAQPQQHHLVDENRRLFAQVILPFVSQLDAKTDGSGKSLLDRSLVIRVSQLGEFDHNATSGPMITFGGADGAMKTGNYLDYRNFDRPWTHDKPGPQGMQYHGLPIHQFYGSMLRLMGVPHAEWAERDHGGFGPKVIGRFLHLSCCNSQADVSNYYTPAIWGSTGEVLPWLGA